MPSHLPQFAFRATAEVFRRLNWLAERSGVSAARWVIGAVNAAYDSAHDSSATRNGDEGRPDVGEADRRAP